MCNASFGRRRHVVPHWKKFTKVSLYSLIFSHLLLSPSLSLPPSLSPSLSLWFGVPLTFGFVSITQGRMELGGAGGGELAVISAIGVPLVTTSITKSERNLRLGHTQGQEVSRQDEQSRGLRLPGRWWPPLRPLQVAVQPPLPHRPSSAP